MNDNEKKALNSMVAAAQGEKRDFYRDTRLEAFAKPILGGASPLKSMARLDSGDIVQYTFSKDPGEPLDDGLTSTFLGQGVALAPAEKE